MLLARTQLFDFCQVQDVSLRHHIQISCQVNPASDPLDTGGSIHGEKRLGRESDQSPPLNAEI
jgi:hypothetical protein